VVVVVVVEFALGAKCRIEFNKRKKELHRRNDQ